MINSLRSRKDSGSGGMKSLECKECGGWVTVDKKTAAVTCATCVQKLIGGDAKPVTWISQKELRRQFGVATTDAEREEIKATYLAVHKKPFQL